jgi:DNA-binding response OmpR family regulator
MCNLSHMPERRNEPVCEATIGGISVQMPQSEYEVLRALQQRQGAPLTAAALEHELTVRWRHKVPGQYAQLTIFQLRKRLQHAGLPGHQLIRNAYGRGYYWVEPGQEPVPRT